ncbi:MAG: DedA family protein [Nitrospinota bacterium]|nr:MAG: DedA family protein [Nitrospinota bacterium]
MSGSNYLVFRVAGRLKRLYAWVVHWAETPYGATALFLLAFAESSFFPIPPDVLLIALALSVPARAFWFATVSSAGSVLGGMFGYFLGLQFMERIGYPLLQLYGALDTFAAVQELYQRYEAWAVGIAGFTPIPYKVFTIAAGAFQVHFGVFVLASLLSRSARFFLIALLLYYYGEPIKEFIERYFNLLSLLFVALLVLGFLLIKWVL